MKKNSNMTFLEHLEELRWHLVRSTVAIVIIAVIAFIYKNIVFDIIIMGPSHTNFITNDLMCKFGKFFYNFMQKNNINIGHENILCINDKAIPLLNTAMTGQFMTHIKISIICGIVVAFPYITFEIWQFIKPALYQNEKKNARGAVFVISVLFLIGVCFGYFIISPLSINFLSNYNLSDSIKNNFTIMSFVSIVASVSLASGILFELPSIIYFLSKIGLVTPKFLKKYRRHALIVMLILSAIITPPDVFSQLLVCFPLIILYEISIRISKRIIAKTELTKN